MTRQKRIAVGVTVAWLAPFFIAIAILGTSNTGARCPKPVDNYRTRGTMPSGQTVVLPDGDNWTCDNGRVIVH